MTIRDVNSKIDYLSKIKKINEAMKKRRNNNQMLNIFRNKNIRFNLRDNYNSIIPKKLFTCWHTKVLPPKMNENYQLLKTANPEFEHILFDENDCRNFIKQNFNSNVLHAYESLVPCAYKSDLWRYCVLYKLGGIYLDIKYKTVNGFKLIALTEKEYFVRDLDSSFKGIYNALIVSLPGNNILLNCINQIVNNVTYKYYGTNCLAVTGPSLLARHFTSEQRNNMELYLETCNVENVINTFYICWHNNIILGKYKEYYDEQRQYQKESRYSDLWVRKAIYR